MIFFIFFGRIEHKRELETYYAYPKEIVLYEDVRYQPSKDVDPQHLLESVVRQYSEFGYVDTFVEVNPGIYKIVIHKYDTYNR